MEFILTIFIFTFGAIIGSFLNVVALRFGSGKGVKGRSFCFSCGKTLNALELVPILSFIFQKGRCRGCESKISVQYPLVETLTGVVFSLIYFHTVFFADFIGLTQLFNFIFYCFIFSVLIVICIYDIKHKVIPDSLVFTFILFSIAGLILKTGVSNIFHLPYVFDFLSGIILFLPFFLLWAISRGAWMGFGDAKLAIGIGFFLGLSSGVSAIIIGFWVGAIWSVLAIIIQKFFSTKRKKLSFASEIPFAPFLIFGVLIAFLFNPDLFMLKEFFF